MIGLVVATLITIQLLKMTMMIGSAIVPAPTISKMILNQVLITVETVALTEVETLIETTEKVFKTDVEILAIIAMETDRSIIVVTGHLVTTAVIDLLIITGVVALMIERIVVIV